MKKIFRKEVIIALIVIFCLVVLFVGIDFLKGINVFKASNYYYATFDNVEGLTVSSPVTLNGYKVGQVRDITYEYDNPGHVQVELSLDKNLRVPLGTQAVMSSDLLGTASVVLKLGDKNRGYCNIGDKLEGVQSPSLMASLGSDLMPKVSQTFTKVDTLLTSLNTLVTDPALAASIGRLDAISADLAFTSAQIKNLSLAMPPIMGNVRSITGNVNLMTEDMKGSTADLRRVTSALAEARVDSLLDNITATTANLRRLTAELSNPNSTLGLLMGDGQLYYSLTRTVSTLDSLFTDIKRNPKRYISIKLL